MMRMSGSQEKIIPNQKKTKKSSENQSHEQKTKDSSIKEKEKRIWEYETRANDVS